MAAPNNMSNTQASTQRVAIILNRPKRPGWMDIKLVKTEAMANKIREYVKPSTVRDKRFILKEPTISSTLEISILRRSLLICWILMRLGNRSFYADYEHQGSGIQVEGKSTRKPMLFSYKNQFLEPISHTTFTFETRYHRLVKFEVANRSCRSSTRDWNLSTSPWVQNIDSLLQEWEWVYTESKEPELPDVDKDCELPVVYTKNLLKVVLLRDAANRSAYAHDGDSC
jgi:hypothetical protein